MASSLVLGSQRTGQSALDTSPLIERQTDRHTEVSVKERIQVSLSRCVLYSNSARVCWSSEGRTSVALTEIALEERVSTREVLVGSLSYHLP